MQGWAVFLLPWLGGSWLYHEVRSSIPLDQLKTQIIPRRGVKFVFCLKLILQFSAVPRDILQRARRVRLGSGLPPLQKASIFFYMTLVWAKVNFFKVRILHIHNFFGSFRYHKSSYIWGVPVRKLQIHNFVWSLLYKNSQIYLVFRSVSCKSATFLR